MAFYSQWCCNTRSKHTNQYETALGISTLYDDADMTCKRATMSSSSLETRIAIVGGRMEGLALAVALSKLKPEDHLEVNIYESASKLIEVGTGISFWPRGWEIMRNMGLEASLLSKLFPAGHKPLPEELRLLFSVRKGNQRKGTPILDKSGGTIPFHLADVQGVLLDHSSPSIQCHLSHRLVNFDETEDGVVLKFTNGTTATCDLLVGADGIHSRVRRSLLSELKLTSDQEADRRALPLWTGVYVYRYMIDANALRREYPDHPALQKMMIYCGKNKMMTAYPIRGGKFINVAPMGPGGSVGAASMAARCVKCASVLGAAARMAPVSCQAMRHKSVTVRQNEETPVVLVGSRSQALCDRLHFLGRRLGRDPLKVPRTAQPLPGEALGCPRHVSELESCVPATDPDGGILPRNHYIAQLENIRKREPLREACKEAGISVPKTANLEILRKELIKYPEPNSQTPSTTVPSTEGNRTVNASDFLELVPRSIQDDEPELVAQYGVQGANADELLGMDDDDDDEENGEENGEDVELEEVEEGGSVDEALLGGPRPGESYSQFKTRVRLEETQYAEKQRRPGGIKTQKAMVKAWKEFRDLALQRGDIKDEIIDEHHLLLYIRFCAERPKRDRRGFDIEETRIGASHIKKLYFGALRIRKEQDAKDPSLLSRRPATSIHVWDSLRSRMYEAIRRSRNGLVPGEDAPDIVANTFLASITEEQIIEVAKGFLKHRELRSAIMGFLAWNFQNATRNRGDDFRALLLAELQPTVFTHPNGKTAIWAVLGCQGEEKAGASRGMRTTVNPVYSVMIAHRNPALCPLGALAFYNHFLHDIVNITEELGIDWSINKSWRKVRLLHGKKSLCTPYHEQSLYRLYKRAFAEGGLADSSIIVHLPRHMLGYREELIGVNPEQTSRMGWVRGSTYFDKYAPALPKEAVLGAHGYKSDEPYDPAWRHIVVPPQFLTLMCPQAEGIHASVVGKRNLHGAANYWSMIIELRPYLFQCGAAVYQICPESALFRLPAFKTPDVLNWMKSQFPNDLARLKAREGSELDLALIENELLRQALSDLKAIAVKQDDKLDQLYDVVVRRTGVLSPTKGFSLEAHQS
ncbi:hypothetical protein D9613_011520 [Agrocybe pediades]|uniref:FAD-binding domain-containing protein n=1 Tax=Agrocybe pediades TaxID=84607 RepID=A0A8H4VQF8_9AGAR|nr:hypothetical protein D9613_011520 [Agrocybe pediades]